MKIMKILGGLVAVGLLGFVAHEYQATHDHARVAAARPLAVASAVISTPSVQNDWSDPAQANVNDTSSDDNVPQSSNVALLGPGE